MTKIKIFGIGAVVLLIASIVTVIPGACEGIEDDELEMSFETEEDQQAEREAQGLPPAGEDDDDDEDDEEDSCNNDCCEEIVEQLKEIAHQLDRMADFAHTWSR